MPSRQTPPTLSGADDSAPTFDPSTLGNTDTGPSYIGVDSSFPGAVRPIAGRTTSRPGQAGMVTEIDPTARLVPPSYIEGDELTIYSMPAPQLAKVQQQLVRAGLLDEGDFTPGAITGALNDATIGAYGNLLGYANRAGYTKWQDALDTLTRAGLTPNQRTAQQRAHPLPQATNADDLRPVFRAAVIDTLGTGWTEGQIDRLVQTYQAAERAYGQQNMDGAATEQILSPENFAVREARDADPTAAMGQDFLGAANQFFDLLGGARPSGQLPGTER